MSTHPLLDYTNTYGLRPFLPWNPTWYYGDLLPIIDPYLDAVLFTGITAGEMFRKNKRFITWLSLGIVILYLVARLELRSMATSQVQTFAALTPGTEKWGVAPQILNPLVWEGIVQSKKQMLKVRIDAWDRLITETVRLDRTAPSEIPKQALDSRSAMVLLGFARFPVMRVRSTDFDYRIQIFDFRFYNARTSTALGSEIALDRAFHIKTETLSFQKTIE